MEFEPSERSREYQQRLLEFMDEHVYPAEPVYKQQMAESGHPNFHPPVLEELKEDEKSADGPDSTTIIHEGDLHPDATLRADQARRDGTSEQG